MALKKHQTSFNKHMIDLIKDQQCFFFFKTFTISIYILSYTFVHFTPSASLPAFGTAWGAARWQILPACRSGRPSHSSPFSAKFTMSRTTSEADCQFRLSFKVSANHLPVRTSDASAATIRYALLAPSSMPIPNLKVTKSKSIANDHQLLVSQSVWSCQKMLLPNKTQNMSWTCFNYLQFHPETRDLLLQLFSTPTFFGQLVK